MNYQYFNYLYEASRYDEIKVIGKDIIKQDGNHQEQFYHILGMTLKEKQAVLYVLEFLKDSDEERESCMEERIPRISLKSSIEDQNRQSPFLQVREFQIGDKIYPVSGGTSGPIRNNEQVEAFFLFLRMIEAGWKPEDSSPFSAANWNCFTITCVELEGEYDSLPEWKEEVQMTYHETPDRGIVEIPVLLETDKKNSLEFKLSDGKAAHCYINKVFVLDVWEEQKKKFADPAYIEKMLEHVSEQEFEEMKKNFFETLEEHCPKGECYLAFYYECDADIWLEFYDREYLDTPPKPSKGRASSMFMTVRPEEKTGEHGLPLKGAVIQKPISKDVVCLEAELYSYSGRVQTKKEYLFKQNGTAAHS